MIDISFIAVVVTAVEDNATVCSLIDAMEMTLHLAESFQSNGRKYFQKCVILNELKELEDVTESNKNQCGPLLQLSLDKALASSSHKGIIGYSKYDRQLAVMSPGSWVYKGLGRCKLCSNDNSDCQNLLSNPSDFDNFMSEHMTKDIKAYILKKNLNASPSCYGDPENAIVDFLLLE